MQKITNWIESPMSVKLRKAIFKELELFNIEFIEVNK